MTDPDLPYTYPVTDVPASAGPTPWQTVGPFFHYSLPYDGGPDVAGPDRPGTFALTGRVLDGDGQPVPDALVEIWQADERGAFVDLPGIYAAAGGSDFRGFGRSGTDEDGHYRFRTVKPAGVPTSDGTPQAPHLAMSVFARGMLRRAVTRVYFDDEPGANSADPLLTSVDAGRVGTLMATGTEDGYRFDVHIQGDDETVFLHVLG